MAIRSAFREFARNESGNFAIILSILALPILALAGLGLDYARIHRAETQLQSSVDAAIAAAASQRGTVASMQRTVSDFIETNYPDGRVSVKTLVDTFVMRVEAKQEVSTSVLAAMGSPEVQISASAKLTSRTPLRQSGVSHSSASSTDRDAIRRKMQQKRRAFSQAIRNLPPSRQRELRRQYDRQLQLMSQQRSRRSAGYYISE
ncbi:MAG: pilus assembly protein TadG-related protein [Pseudomonadota bacterium]